MRTGRYVAAAALAGLLGGMLLSWSVAAAQDASTETNPKVKQLLGCIDHFKQARASWSQEPTVQQDYTAKIADARRMIADLKAGTDIAQDKIDKACASPSSAPY